MRVALAAPQFFQLSMVSSRDSDQEKSGAFHFRMISSCASNSLLTAIVRSDWSQRNPMAWAAFSLQWATSTSGAEAAVHVEAV
jgi:hypothetical protein